MIYLLSNTLFGYRNNNPEWLKIMTDYFHQEFIPFLQKHGKEGDEVIHLGNLFANTNINIPVLNQVYDIIEKISQILPLKLLVGVKDKTENNSVNSFRIFRGLNKVQIIEKIYQTEKYLLIPHSKKISQVLSNLNVPKYIFIHQDWIPSLEGVQIFNGFSPDYGNMESIQMIGSPYQMRKEDQNKKRGFVVVKENPVKTMMMINQISPIFQTIRIKNSNDVDELDPKYFEKNFIDLEIEKELMETQENKVRVALSQFKISEVRYISKEEDQVEVENSMNDLKIQEMVIQYLIQEESEDLIPEFEKLVQQRNSKIVI